ncbi:MAG: hypothetical protein AB7F89_20085 [Pirellulaceae bacterium]
MHNALTHASFEVRMAEHHDGIMNEALERPADFRSETTQRRIAAAGDNVLKHLLLTDEYQLTAPVQGTSEFASQFAKGGPADSRGRSLRHLDLQRRLFRYPCSYLIYSPSFDALPEAVQDYIYRTLDDILAGRNQDAAYTHLSRADRDAIREILLDTKAEFRERVRAAG